MFILNNSVFPRMQPCRRQCNLFRFTYDNVLLIQKCICSLLVPKKKERKTTNSRIFIIF